MSIALDATLAIAQDGQSHRPIVEIITGQISADIPFIGERLTNSSPDESKPNAIAYSTGRLAGLYRVSGHLYYFYTDAARLEFTYVDLSLGAFSAVVEATLCELADGNIGIILITATKLVRMVITVEGVVVSSASEVATFTSGMVTSPFVIKLQDGSYLLVYSFNNGGNYEIDKRTSADFLTWSAATNLEISGLVATNRIDHTSLIQITTGQIWLWFDYLNGSSGTNELVNVYYATSDDNGGTWSAATKFTNYTKYGTIGKHPVAVQNLANQMMLVYYEQTGALHIDGDTTGFCHPEGKAYNWVSDITLDSVNRKLYCTCTLINAFICVYRVDIDTWVIDACWNDVSIPAFPAHHYIDLNYVWTHRNTGDQHLIPIGSEMSGSGIMISLLDGEADTIQNFYFVDIPAEGITQNVSWTPIPSGAHYLTHTYVDHIAQRLYAVIVSSSISNPGVIVGYFDLTDSSPTKTFVPVVTDTSISADDAQAMMSSGSANLEIYSSVDLILLTMTWNFTGVSFIGALKIYHLSTGAVYKEYRTATHTGFPYHGLREAVYVGGKIYGGFTYDTVYYESDKRGLCCIDLATDVITFFRPPWATADSYGIGAINFTDDNRLIVVCGGYGIGIFNLGSQTWDPNLYNNDSIPGMDPSYPPGVDGRYNFSSIVFDPVTNLIFVGAAHYYDSWKGLIGFSEEGEIRQTKYQIGNYTDVWTWDPVADLVTGFQDYDAVALYGGDSIYAFWTRENQDTDINSIAWDRVGSILNLDSYIAKSEEIALEWNIDGSPNRLSFAVSHGHLFDPHNVSSLLSGYLRKGKKLTVRMGEKISGTSYWQNQGTFYVTELKITYENPIYPLAHVVALDIRCFWDHKEILVSDYYNTYPELILQDVLTSELGMVVGDIITPNFDNRIVIYGQWIETLAKDIIDQVCNRFGYFAKITVDNDFSARKISDVNVVDHIYTDLLKILNFSPDDTYSDFTNQVIITGTERTEIEVIYNEEVIGDINGTIGWWGCKQTYDIYFSNDRSRRCRSVRLKILESTTSIGFEFAGGGISESITYINPDETYCTITVTAPNLIPQLLGFIAIIIANLATGDAVIAWGGGWTRPVGTLIQMIALIGANMILGAIGNFQYEVWGRTVGTIRRSIQSDSIHGQDLDHQIEVGAIITKKFEETFASTVEELNMVADQEVLIAKLQRKRVTFSKIAHLQDEVGDTIRIKHPYTVQDLDVFATRLTRRMRIAEKSNDSSAYFTDDIEGWKVNG